MSDKMEELKVVSLPELDLQGITFLNAQVIVHHEESADFFNLFDCFGIDGIIGTNMLRNSVVQFDEQSKQIIITNTIKNLSMKKVAYQKMELLPNPHINIGLRKDERKIGGTRVLFDTGAANIFYAISMYEYRMLERVIDKVAETEGAYTWGAHGFVDKQQHALLNVPELVVNKVPFNNVVAVAITRSGSLIGSKLLRYGKITLDYKKKRFYFESFDNINTDELSKKPSSINYTVQNGKVVVGIIWDKELESQINLGDEVLSIDDIDIQSLGLCEFFTLPKNTSSNDKQILKLRDIKTEEIKEVEIKHL